MLVVTSPELEPAVILDSEKHCQSQPSVGNVFYCGQVAQQETRYFSSMLVVRFPLAEPIPQCLAGQKVDSTASFTICNMYISYAVVYDTTETYEILCSA
jgi:hypothetical protein